MDIVIKSLLNHIQSNEKTSNAVLAGGAVRDTILNLPIKDYDILIPVVKSPTDIALDLAKEFKIQDLKHKSVEGYGISTGFVRTVYGCSIEGKKVDLIFTKITNNEEFPDTVINEFDYGLNMCFDNGRYIEDNNEFFHHDIDAGTMTLVNLDSIDCLPKSMMRFYNFNNKYKKEYGYELRFRSIALEVINKKKSTYLGIHKDSYYRPKLNMTGNTFTTNPNDLPDGWAAPAPDAGFVVTQQDFADTFDTIQTMINNQTIATTGFNQVFPNGVHQTIPTVNVPDDDAEF